jgi:hypothetical protein
MTFESGSGGLWSTLDDYLRFSLACYWAMRMWPAVLRS